ncbi:hypothetical protein [Sphingomonas desiccabilis]|uniref:Biopolymer transporter ExbD n=1 Tax=Sphingomonas desiccabilis TaxID=429134 RepID=A0A4Q2IQB8_9SPHN|nr:hypothetical protein [Sphingomonas desiccabilis]MBB3911423.1 hypothetical protein [Sphingomonas desiccabilis]RXZ31802.1 hypothetical protein EO081_11415 [Sphingomonas desiccabilis]
MLTFALLILAPMQDAPSPAPVKLVVPAGPCKPMVDGVVVTLDGLRAATGQWAAAKREVRFEPDAKADPACMQDVLKLLGAAGAGEKFPLAFVENEAMSGVEGD